MLLDYEIVENKLVVKLNGELDHHVAEEIRQELDQLIETKPIKDLVFDLRDLRFMDSSGIGVMMGRYKSISQMGGRLAIVNVSEKVDLIFTMSGLYKIIEKFSSLKEALNRM